LAAKWTAVVFFACLLFFGPLFSPCSAVSAEKRKPKLSKEAAKLVGRWAIYQTKEPGKPFRQSYKGRPFVMKGANAFTLIVEYRPDGTFSRFSRIGEKETIHEGKWKYAGHELRHKRKKVAQEEVMYVRFDGAGQFTSIEVYEKTADPGLFARFRRVD